MEEGRSTGSARLSTRLCAAQLISSASVAPSRLWVLPSYTFFGNPRNPDVAFWPSLGEDTFPPGTSVTCFPFKQLLPSGQVSQGAGMPEALPRQNTQSCRNQNHLVCKLQPLGRDMSTCGTDPRSSPNRSSHMTFVLKIGWHWRIEWLIPTVP